MPNYLEIAVAAPVATSLSYLLPEELADKSGTLIGRRALVPLGKRRVTGYILAENQPPQELAREGEKSFAIKKIISLLDDTPLFHPEMVPFFRWIDSTLLSLSSRPCYQGGTAGGINGEKQQTAGADRR